MKKLFKLLPLFLVAVTGATALSSCHDDDDNDQIITISALPDSAKEFVSQYFPQLTIVSAKIDGNEYEVKLTDGTTIDFDKTGNWIDVDAPNGKTVPGGFYPEGIDMYILANYPENGINEISKEFRGYEVDLTSGIDLKFDVDGNFVSADW